MVNECPNERGKSFLWQMSVDSGPKYSRKTLRKKYTVAAAYTLSA